jgi:hypothetical protein
LYGTNSKKKIFFISDPTGISSVQHQMKLPAASGRGIKAELHRSHCNFEMI